MEKAVSLATSVLLTATNSFVLLLHLVAVAKSKTASFPDHLICLLALAIFCYSIFVIKRSYALLPPTILVCFLAGLGLARLN